MFQWLYNETIGTLVAPKEETIGDRIQNAVINGDLSALEREIMSGFDVVNYMEQGNGLIHLAAYHGQLRMIQRLITQGCFVNQPGRDGNIALHYACYNHHEECIMFLINNGSSLVQKNNEGRTPYDMCKNIGLRQKLLPLYMKATNEEEARVASSLPASEPLAPPPTAMGMQPVPMMESQSSQESMMAPPSVPAFRHPSLNRSSHRHVTPYAPTPLPGASQEVNSFYPSATPSMEIAPTPVVPINPMVPAPAPVAPTPVAPTPVTAPTPARSFGLAGKGPRVVAGGSRAPVASRISKYTPPAPAPAPAPTPMVATPAPMAVPAPMVAPMTAPPAPMAAPTPVTPTPMVVPTPTPVIPITPATPGPQFPSAEQSAVYTKPKPAKPIRRVRAKPDGFITTVGNPELAQKYGNVTKSTSGIAPPPGM